VDDAIDAQRNAYHNMLLFVDKDLLKEIRDKHTVPKELESDFPDLLHNLIVVEYINGTPPWYDVHPIVRDLL
jgi:hypothetical protein